MTPEAIVSELDELRDRMRSMGFLYDMERLDRILAALRARDTGPAVVREYLCPRCGAMHPLEQVACHAPAQDGPR